MFSEKNRLYLLILIMVMISFISVGLSLFSIYDTMIQDRKHQLQGLVKRQARLFESVAAVDLAHFKSMGKSQDEAFAYTLGQFKETFESYYGSDKTGEIVLGERLQDHILFLLSGRNGQLKENSTLPLALKHMAEPMQKALSGESGIMIGHDYRDVTVLAAYEPIHIYKTLGIVAKVEVKELQNNFIELGLKVSLMALIMILLGVKIFNRVAGRMVAKGIESEKQYETLIEHLPDHLIRMDRDLNITYVSPNISKLAGRKMEEYIGKNVKSFGYPKAVIDFWLQGYRSVLAKGETREFDYTMLIDGEQRHLSWRVIPEPDSKGDVESLLVMIRDQSRELHAEAALKRSETRYRQLLETMQEGLAVADMDGNIVECNYAFCEMLGYSQKELIGKNFRELTPEKWHEQEDRILQEEVLPKGHSPLYEKEYFTRSGSIVPVEIHAYLLTDERKAATGFWAIVRDISDIKQQEEFMLAQSRQAAMGDMISMIAHQWRQPLSVIGMSLNTLELNRNLGKLSDEKLEEFTSRINEQVKYLDHTINDFRNFFKPQKRKIKTTVASVVEDALKIIGQTLENHTIHFSKNIAFDQQVMIHGRELQQVILNLLTNAKDAIISRKIKDGWIHLTVNMEGETIKIDLCDNGGGIEEAAMQKLTEPYFTTKAENGTGLGLYMSKSIIEKHFHGKLTYRNEGEGACFCIEFPLPSEEDAA